MSEKEKCPYCGSTDISCHLGRCECRDCGKEWSVQESDKDKVKAVAKS